MSPESQRGSPLLIHRTEGDGDKALKRLLPVQTIAEVPIGALGLPREIPRRATQGEIVRTWVHSRRAAEAALTVSLSQKRPYEFQSLGSNILANQAYGSRLRGSYNPNPDREKWGRVPESFPQTPGPKDKVNARRRAVLTYGITKVIPSTE